MIALVSIALMTVLGVYVMQRRKSNRIIAQNRQYEMERRASSNSEESHTSGIELQTVTQI